MSWVAVGVGVASALGGAAASMDASGKQAAAGKAGLELQAGQSAMNKMTLDPFVNSGYQAQWALKQGLGLNGINPHGANAGQIGSADPNASLMKPFSLQDFHASPAYQFNLAEGTKAIDKAANARGNLYAPQTLQDISKFSQGTASNEFNNAYTMYNQNQANQYNRLSGLSGQGLSAANAEAGVNTNLANNMAEGMQGVGNAQASGIMGANNAFQGGIGQAYNQYLMNQILKQNQGSLYASGPAGGGGNGIFGMQG